MAVLVFVLWAKMFLYGQITFFLTFAVTMKARFVESKIFPPGLEISVAPHVCFKLSYNIFPAQLTTGGNWLHWLLI